MMKVYIASPLFTVREKYHIRQVERFLKEQGYSVFLPMDNIIPGADDMSNKEWGRRVFLDDTTAIIDSDIVVVLDYGYTSDAGTAWECGFAHALNKKVFVISMIQDVAVHSIMLYNGCTRFFDSLDSFFKFIKGKDFSVVKQIEQK